MTESGGQLNINDFKNKCTIGAEDVMELGYPYLLERVFSKVGAHRIIKFEIGKPESDLASNWSGIDDNKLIVTVPEGYGGTDSAIHDFLVEFLKADILKTRRNLCLVISPRFCIYVTSTGKVIPSDTLPTGGLIIHLTPKNEGANVLN